MRANDFDIGDPTVDTEGNLRLGRINVEQENFDTDTLRSAFDACGDLLAGVSFGFDADDLTELADQLLVFAACMRDNGYDIPDPDLAPGTVPDDPFGGLDLEDPAFITALEVCEDTLPGFGRPIERG